MNRKRALIGILLVAMLLSIVPALSLADPASSPAAQDEPVNLLQNPGFEGLTCDPGSEPGWCNGNWSNSANHDGSIHDNIFTPQGWVTWWRKGGDYGQPEVKTIPKVQPFTGDLERIRSGNYAVLLFTFYRLQDTGLYQVVSGLEPGATVQFSAYAHGWSCDKDDPMGYTCSDPWNQRFQVGIEPNGVADPFSPNVIWSAETLAPDQYKLIGPVSAQVGESGSVCVFLRSQTKWGYKYQDAYWDDASLVMTSPGTPPTSTPLPAPPTATPGPSPTPRATPTPRPDGAIVHIVESGDTLYGIALMYNADPDQIRELNAGSLGEGDMLWPGMELVISIPDEAPTPTPPPTPPTEESGGAENPGGTGGGGEESIEATGTGGAGGASICVLAYHDRNSDTFRDDEGTEELLPNAEFTLADASGVLAKYTSDGVSEPYCFTGLATGAYRVILNSPAGYAPSGPAEWPVAVSEGSNFEIQFGNVRSEGAGTAAEIGENPEEEAPPAGESEDGSGGSANQASSSDNSTFSNVFSLIAKISGVLVLLLAAGMATLFVLNRRRM